MKVYECKTIEVGPYKYRLLKRAGKVTRVMGFAGKRPALWEFLVGLWERRESAVGIAEPGMLDNRDGRVVLCLEGPRGRFLPEGRELCWDAMPESVRAAVRFYGGKMFKGRCMVGRKP